jgi:biotin carboxyl carrier protein
MVEEINNLVNMAKEAGIRNFSFKGKGIRISFSFARGHEVSTVQEIAELPQHEVHEVVEEIAQPSEVEVKSEFIGILLWEKKADVAPGSKVKKDQIIAYVESLGVKHEIKSPVDGEIKEILPEGSIVDYGKVICRILPA